MITFVNILKEKANKNKRLIQNFSYLSLLQVFNMLMPLFTYPYLIRVLGIETYGMIIFAQAIVSYFLIFVSYGFSTSATKEVSIYRDDKRKLGEIFGSVLITKVIILIMSFILLKVVLRFVPQLIGQDSLFLLSMWVCLYDVIFPVWYFLGIEKMKYITLFTLISRSISLILIFIMIKIPEHYLRVPLINGIGAMVAGIGAIIIIFKDDKIKFFIPKISQIKYHFRRSTPYFISELSVNVFLQTNKVVLGSVLGMAEVAYYDLAEKIINIFRRIPLGIVRNTIFPRVAKTKNISIVHKTTIIMTVFALLSVIFINLIAPQMIKIIGGESMIESLGVLRLFSIAIITTHISNYYLTIGLWSLDFNIEFRNAMIFSCILYILILSFLYIFNLIGLYILVWCIILIDVFQALYCLYIYRKKGLSKIKLL